jgi:hypothetical protein
LWRAVEAEHPLVLTTFAAKQTYSNKAITKARWFKQHRRKPLATVKVVEEKAVERAGKLERSV